MEDQTVKYLVYNKVTRALPFKQKHAPEPGTPYWRKSFGYIMPVDGTRREYVPAGCVFAPVFKDGRAQMDSFWCGDSLEGLSVKRPYSFGTIRKMIQTGKLVPVREDIDYGDFSGMVLRSIPDIWIPKPEAVAEEYGVPPEEREHSRFWTVQ